MKSIFVFLLLNSSSQIVSAALDSPLWAESVSCSHQGFSLLIAGTHGYRAEVQFQTFRGQLKNATGEIIYPHGTKGSSQTFDKLETDKISWLPGSLSMPFVISDPDQKEKETIQLPLGESPKSILPKFPKGGVYSNPKNTFDIQYRHNQIWSFSLISFEQKYSFSFDKSQDKYSREAHMIAARLRTFDRFALIALKCCAEGVPSDSCLRNMR